MILSRESILGFIAHQLYMQSCTDGYGVLWLAMDPKLQGKWLERATKVVESWQKHEDDRKLARESDNPISLPQMRDPR